MSLLEVLRPRLPQQPQDIVARDDVDMDLAATPVTTPPVKAAVLLPIIERAEAALLFTRRTATLAKHSGQVSFPGGRSEAHDLSPLETALRETFEETGIDPGHVTLAGYLDRLVTGTGFDIQPVVGVVAPGFALNPDAGEVAQVFEVPLAFLLDPVNRRRESRQIGGRTRHYYAFTHDGHEIWGATAAIIVGLAQRLDGISLNHAD
jgi:8-oxo-dGTP pyrophosphatase MutT (NUDIX family)